MMSKRFWLDALERVVSTASQALLGSLGTDALVTDLSWRTMLSITASAAVVCLLKCLAASRTGDPTSASLVEPD